MSFWTEFWEIAWKSIVFVFPAYLANGAPTILGGGPPVDMGKNWRDGRRLFGNNKTIRGLIVGLSIGILTGQLMMWLFPEVWEDFSLGVAFLLGTGAMLGDLGGSFAKRRRDLPSGSRFFPWDQIGWIVPPVLLVLPLGMPWQWGVFVIILSPLVHVAANYLAYSLKLKDVWW